MNGRGGFAQRGEPAAAQASRLWTGLVLFGLGATAEPRRRGADDFVHELGRAADGRLAFPAPGVSARLAAEGFVRLATAWCQAVVPERRAALAPAVVAAAAALKTMLDAEAAEAARARRRFED